MRISTSSEATKQLAATLAPYLQAGDVIVLSGDLGAGKTQFVQGVAAGLGVRDQVTSPTFNILLTYPAGSLPLYHFDLYRLEEADELEDIGYYETIDGDGASFVEWGEKFPRVGRAACVVAYDRVDGFRGSRGSTRVEHPAAAPHRRSVGRTRRGTRGHRVRGGGPRPGIVHGRAHRDGYGEGHRVSTRGAAGWRIVA